MEYRILGRTGLKVSALGFGGHEYRRPLPTTLGKWGVIDDKEFLRKQALRNRIIKSALDAGVNFFDATQVEETKSLGIALKELNARKQVYAAIMILRPFHRMADLPETKWRQFMFDDVHKKLRLLQSDYADVLNLHMPERGYTQKRMAVALEVFEELRQEGTISYLGASSHDLPFLAELIRRFDCFDSVMVRYNYHLQEAKEVIFPLCRVFEIGVVIMKPLACPYYGIPFMRFGSNRVNRNTYTLAQTSIRWILTSPEVTTIVPGMNSLKEVDENLDAINKEKKIDDKLLSECLEKATASHAKKVLQKMLDDPAIDIRYFAERALNS